MGSTTMSEYSEYEDILCDARNAIARITIDRPEKYNAFRGKMFQRRLGLDPRHPSQVSECKLLACTMGRMSRARAWLYFARNEARAFVDWVFCQLGFLLIRSSLEIAQGGQ